MDWQFKQDAPMQGSSNDFWYDMTDGGYIKPELVLADAEQLRLVSEAVALLKDFERALEDACLLNEF